MMDSLDEIRLDYLAGHMSDIIKNESMNFYWSQKSSSMYTMGGTAADWFYSDEGSSNNTYRAAAFTIELPDGGFHKFLLPETQVTIENAAL